MRTTRRVGTLSLLLALAVLCIAMVAGSTAATGSSGATGATGTTGKPAAPAPPPPSNDDRDNATALGSLPAQTTGTTVGATVESNEPNSQCAATGGSVWYSLTTNATPPGRIGVKLNAGGKLDAVVDVFLQQRSQLTAATCVRTGTNGVGGVTFNPVANATYLIRVAQLINSDPGPFSLEVFVAPPPPHPPGAPLSPNGSSGRLDGTFNNATAYSMHLTAGTTYKITLVKRQQGCTSLDIFPPGTTSFSGGSVAGLSCAGYRLFTPNVSGLWSFLVSADTSISTPQRFALHVAPANFKETAPGIPLPNFATFHGILRANVNTDVRLFRFDVTSLSDTQLILSDTSGTPFDLKLLTDQGRYLQCVCGQQGEVTIRRQTPPGRYFAVVQAEGFGWGPFTLFRETRLTTHVRVAFNGAGYVQTTPGQSVNITATVTPAVAGPVTIEVQRFDPATSGRANLLDAGPLQQ